MTGGRELAYDPAPGRTEAELAIFVMGSALGALLHQRGCFVLHASAAEVDGQAAIFCGQSGAGKSSLVAALCGAGRGLVADDVCVVQFDREGRPLAVPDGRRLKLWSDAVKRLSLEGRRGAPVRDGIEKYWVDPPMHVPTTSLPIEDIFFLRDARQATGTAIEPLPLLEAVELLRAHAYRPRLVAALGQEGEWLRQCVAMMRRTRAFLLTRALNFQELESSLAAIEDHWSRGGH
jgi:energy-coupling factor transporter ATP-binding protein EcfA2